jgi:hypothetical protein
VVRTCLRPLQRCRPPVTSLRLSGKYIEHKKVKHSKVEKRRVPETSRSWLV